MKAFKLSSCILLSLLMPAWLSTVSAQEKGFSWGAYGSFAKLNSSFSFMNLESHAGYNFNSAFGAYLRAETTVTLLKEKELKSNYTPQALGLLLKYNLYKFNTGIIDIRAGAGKTIFCKDWDYMYWDASIFLESATETTKPAIGFGFRNYNPIKKGDKSHYAIFISVGFTVN